MLGLRFQYVLFFKVYDTFMKDVRKINLGYKWKDFRSTVSPRYRTGVNSHVLQDVFFS